MTTYYFAPAGQCFSDEKQLEKGKIGWLKKEA